MDAPLPPKAQFPKKLKFLFEPHPYKVLYGGRYGLKSWSIARALLILGSTRRIRVLCTREIQKVLKESVHKLLEDMIAALGLGHFYQVLDTEIRGLNGTEFIFSGLQEHTAVSIKSFEGVDICWVEEAQSVSKKSWDVLLFTIRKSGSEFWISFNPELETDEAYVRFVLHPPDGAVVAQMNWRDAQELGWLTKEMEDKRRHAEATMSKEEYDNIIEGKPRSSVAGAIYSTELFDLTQSGRITKVPYDPRLQVHAVFDLGWNMVCGLWQRGLGRALYGIGYVEESTKTIDWFATTLRDMRLNWGSIWLPHDGFVGNAAHPTGHSAEEIFKAHGFDVKRVPNTGTAGAVEFGIKAAKMVFKQTYLDAEKMACFIEHAKRYRRHVSKQGVVGDPLHDEHSHAADMFRHTALSAELMVNVIDPPRPQVPVYRPRDKMTGMLG